MEKATVGIRELKDKASSIIDRVEEGEAITVTKNGRPVARIVSTKLLPTLRPDRRRHGATAPRPPLPADEASQTPRPRQKCRGVRLRGSALSLYLDTSALIKLLVDEPGAEEARTAYSEADGIRTTAIAHVEATAALTRMRKGRRLTPTQLKAGA